MTGWLAKDWVEHFLIMAAVSANKSKDDTKVGAVLVGPHREVLLTAYNGPPMGVLDTPERRVRPTKYLFASHAEANLIAFAARNGIATDGRTVVVTHQPCSSCAKALIQAGIKTIFYGLGVTSMPIEEFEAARHMFEEAGVVLVRS